MFRPRLTARCCGARLQTGIVTHNNDIEVCCGHVRGADLRQHRPLTLERSAMEISIRAKDLQGVVAGVPRKQSASMLASMASLCPTNIIQTTSYMSDSWSSEQMESSTESGGSVKSSILSDGDSANVCGRSPSGASMCTREPGSKEKDREEAVVAGQSTEENEGENEVEEDASDWNEPESLAIKDSHSGTHSIHREHESAATTWTDDKHSSFLNSMEATFVRSLFKQGLDCLNPYGKSEPMDDSEQDCVESRPVDAYGCRMSNPSELFELLQGGNYQQKAYYRPHSLEAPPAPAVLANPWVQHFKQKGLSILNITGFPSPTLPEMISCIPKEVSTPLTLDQTTARDAPKREQQEEANAIQVAEEIVEREGLEHKLMDFGTEVPELDQGLCYWQNRLQSHAQLSVYGNPSVRKDTTTWILKRPAMFDDENADVFLFARSQSRQEELAWKDLEMLEHYNAKQHGQEECTINSLKFEQPEQTPVVQLQKLIPSPIGETNSFTVLQDKDLWRLVGRSAMDQVVPLLGRTESSNDERSIPVSHLNTPLRPTVVSACTAIQAGIPHLKFEATPLNREPLTSALSPTPEAIDVLSEDRCNFRKPEGNLYQPFVWDEQDIATGSYYSRSLLGKHSRGLEGEDDSFAMGMQTTEGLEGGEAYECEPQLSPISSSKAKTWTWGPRGLRRRLHEPSGYTSPSRLRRDAKHSGERIIELEAVL